MTEIEEAVLRAEFGVLLEAVALEMCQEWQPQISRDSLTVIYKEPERLWLLWSPGDRLHSH